MFKVFLLCCVLAASVVPAINVQITVKEPGGFVATNYPVSAMVPLPYGQYQDVSSFRLTDNGGNTVPAQFNPILRHALQDNSIRMVQVVFNATLTAKGSAVFNLKDDNGAVAPADPVTVSENGDIVTVNTGALKFTIKKNGFNLFNKVWLMPGDILVADSTAEQGPVFSTDRGPHRLMDRTVDTFAIEESGPMRVVLRLEGYTRSIDSTTQRPGFIFRITAWAGSRYVKVDAGIINGERTLWGYPYYFQDFSLKTPLSLSGATVRYGLASGSAATASPAAGARLVQNGTNAWAIKDSGGATLGSDTTGLPGWFDASDAQKGVMVTERFFWQTYPNGFGLDAQNMLSVSPFPSTPSYYNVRWANWAMRIDTMSGYWLDDMRGIRKEYLYYFHGAGATDAELHNLNRHFQWPPVATVPFAWHRQCKTTLEFSGVMPDTLAAIGAVSDTQLWAASSFDMASDNYSFGWCNFRSDRRYVCDVGSWPRSTAAFLINGAPGRYFDAELWALGEMNLRGFWCPGWKEAVNQAASGMGKVNYCSGEWRSTALEYYMRREGAYRTGTFHLDWGARDFEHLWTYNVEEFYNYSGDPWIRDCMLFWCEYFKSVEKNVMTDSTMGNMATRGNGHTLASFLMSIRITNGADYKPVADQWIWRLNNRMTKVYPKHSVPNGEGPFQLEFQDRAIASYMQMVEHTDKVNWQRAFQILFGHAEWNTYYGNYCYYWQDSATATCLADTTPGGSGGSYADAQAYMALETQHRPFVNNLKQVWNPGNNMYMNTMRWDGDWMGRTTIEWGKRFRLTPGLDTVPPPAITDLAGAPIDNAMLLSFTKPGDAMKYHIVWGYKPFREGPDTVNYRDTLKWWQAFPGGVQAASGTANESFAVALPAIDTTFYFAVRSFDSLNNLSAISNVFSMKTRISVENGAGGRPGQPWLSACPNPFNPEVAIRFIGAKPGAARSVKIFDMAGKLVKDFGAELGSEKSAAVTLRWNAGERASGVYVIRASAGKTELTRKIILAK